MRRKSRKHSRGGKRISNDRGSTSSDELSELEYVPHDIDVAKWVLGVQNPIQKAGYNSFNSLSPIISRRRSSSSYPMPPPPTPVRSSSRLPLTRIHNYSYPLHQYQQRFQSALNQNNYVRNQLNRYSNKKSRSKSKEKWNKTKSKTLKSVANKQSHRHQKYDKSGSKSKRSSYSKDRSMSKRRQVSFSAQFQFFSHPVLSLFSSLHIYYNYTHFLFIHEIFI